MDSRPKILSKKCVLFSTLTIVFLSTALFVNAQDERRIDMSFSGQLASAVAELKEKANADPDINGRKLRMGEFVSRRMPDSSFELEFERKFKDIMGDLLTDQSSLVVNGEFQVLPGKLKENRGLHVIQIVITVEMQFRVLQTVTREINRSEDITRIAGSTVALPDSTKVEQRNSAAFKSLTEPGFEIRDQHFVFAKGHTKHGVAILKKKGGQGPAVPVVPDNVNGHAFVNLDVDDTFSIVLVNHDKQCDASASVSIDGLDIANTFSVDKTNYQGYLVPRKIENNSGRHLIPGWLKTTKSKNNNVFEFVVNALGKGAATEMKSRNNLGVIHIDFFEAVPPEQDLPSRKFGEVGRGKPLDVQYKTKQMKRRESPIAQISIRYRNQLKE